MKLYITSLLLVVSVWSCSVFADGGSGTQKIGSIYQRSGDGFIAIYGKSGLWGNPDQCDDSSRIVIDGANPYRKDLHASVIASLMSERNFAAYLTGCISWNGVTYPKVYGVYTY